MIKFATVHLQSLQSRLTVFVLVLTILLSIGSYSVYVSQLEIKNTIQQNSAKRNFIVDKKNIVQTELLDSYKALDTFLLDPSNTLMQDWVFSSIDTAITNTNEIVKSEWVASRNNSQLFESMHILLSSLKQEILYLIEIRQDSTRQYPSLQIATQKMRPNRDVFVNSISVALNEVKQGRKISNINIYSKLTDIRYFWSQLVSNFRIYLANQFGTFDLVILSRQEEAIHTQYKNLSALISKLNSSTHENEIGFETADALENMSGALNEWYSAFVQVEVIHHSDKWRVDLNILKTKIQPLLEEISYLFGLFDDEVKNSENEDKQLIDKIINNQMTLLFGVSLTVVIIFTFLLYTIKVVVFKPIGNVTNAIKEEATGLSTRLLPQVNSSEAKDLVDSFNEMRKQIHIRQKDLVYQANHDSLTGLPNRKRFLEEVTNNISLAYKSSSEITVLLIDLNGFKDINDTLGHQIGDKLLIKVGSRLSEMLEESGFIARLGGDEFAILLPDTDKEAAIPVLKNIQRIIDTKFTIEGVNTYIGISIGAAVYPYHGEDENILLRHADVAMYVAKRQKTPYAFYKTSDDSYTLNRLSIIHDIKSSINQDGLLLYYQPKINLNTSKLTSVEALLRWNHPELGLVMPDEFIPIAEQTGFINQITYWVIEEALIQTKKWKESGYDIKIAVNLSVYNLFDVDFINIVQTLLTKYKKVSESLIFEITESAMMSNPKVAISNLNRLRSMGIKLSIDDYGTGFSSLSYLSQLSLNELKIDKSFVLDMLSDERKSIIVQSTIEMAHKLGLEVVAEGVENREVLKRLSSYGCNSIQGYLISRPLPEAEITRWLSSYQAEIEHILN